MHSSVRWIFFTGAISSFLLLQFLRKNAMVNIFWMIKLRKIEIRNAAYLRIGGHNILWICFL